MTFKDTINALPWYQRSAVDSVINTWDQENRLTRFLQGAGNKEEIEALIADFDRQDWSMFGGPGPKHLEIVPEAPETPVDETPEPEAPETPEEEPAPVEDEPAGGTE